MKKGQPSRTAAYMALFRALETTRPASQRLFSDPYAAAFLSPGLRALVVLSRVPPLGNAIRAAIDRRWTGVRTSAVARTKYFDDAILSALGEDGEVRQLVLLGAGYDARAYRMPELAALDVFEVDHPDTSAAKQRAMAARSPALSSHVQFVPVEFGVQSLQAAMAMAGFSPERRTIVVWEGVTNYLGAEAVDATLRWCATLAAGSLLLFTYVHQRLFDAPKAYDGTERLFAALARAGEKWTFGLDPVETRGFLARRGLVLVDDQGATELRARCYGKGAMHMTGYEFYRAAIARVAPKPASRG